MVNTTDTDLTKIVINKLTSDQYAAEAAAGTLSPDEFYILTDWSEDLSNYIRKTELKTINGKSLIGTGDITISGGSGSSINDTTISTSSTYSSSK